MPIIAQRFLALVLGAIQYFLSTQLMSYRGNVSTEEKLFALIIAVIPVLLICCSTVSQRALRFAGWSSQSLILLACIIHRLWPHFFSHLGLS